MFDIREAPLQNPSVMMIVANLMAVPELYWSINDRLSPQPDQLNWPEYLSRQDVATFVASYGPHPIGYVQFIRKTSILAEMTVAFMDKFRGSVAKQLTLYAMSLVFKEKGILKIFGTVPTDNRRALYAARHIGMRKEGVLTQAIVREGGLNDLVVFGITKSQFLAGKQT